MTAASNLQPSNLRLNAYRSLPGGQVFSPCCFSCIYIHRNTRQWLIISKHLFSLFIYHFPAQVLKVCRTPGPTACSKYAILNFQISSINNCELDLLQIGISMLPSPGENKLKIFQNTSSGTRGIAGSNKILVYTCDRHI